jgi:hypothetical protein
LISNIPLDRVDLTLGDGSSLPAIGDIVQPDQGFTGPNGESMGIVFCINSDGTVKWVADVLDSEIELLPDVSAETSHGRICSDRFAVSRGAGKPMGMHFGLIAAKTSLSELRAAFSETWPELEVVDSAEGFANVDDVWSWKSAHERFVSAADWTKDNQGVEAYVLCQDGPWAILMDFSFVLPGDEAALEKLSVRFGSVVSFIVETAGGCAYFSSYESGQLRRMIQNTDGQLAFSGARLPQEEGMAVESYYMKETEQLMRAFGLSLPDELPIVSTAVAIAVADRADYSALARGSDDGEAEARKSSPQAARPWWRFW